MTSTSVGMHPKADVPIRGLVIKTLADARVMERIKVMDRYLFPVKYSEQHYTNVINAGFHPFHQLAFYNDILVGVITCRFENTDVPGELRLYVMTIGVLEPYRRLGIGAHLMQRVIDNVHKETQHKIAYIALHVQIGSVALAFYQSFGFDVKELVTNYYTDLDVRDANLLTRVVPQPNIQTKKK